MTPFTEWIKVNNYPTEFNFRKIQTPDHDKFFISVVDHQGISNISFDITMTRQGKWNIIKPVPEYILLLKEQLIKIIQKHCALTPIPFFYGERLRT